MPQQPLAQVPQDATWFWQEHGACRSVDPTLFFHPQNERGTAHPAGSAPKRSAPSARYGWTAPTTPSAPASHTESGAG